MRAGALATCCLAATSLAACLPSTPAIRRPVDRELHRRIGAGLPPSPRATDPRVPAAVAELLRHPLTLDGARRIALANNRRLQAELDRLGVAAAGVADATVLAPLTVDFQYTWVVDGPGHETELDVIQDVLDLILLPRRRGIATAELAAAQARAVAATVRLVADVEIAFTDMVVAQLQLELRQTAFDAADAAAELAERLHAAGNLPDLDLARELEQQERARIDLGRAQAEVELQREHLNRVLGLTGDATRWTIAATLPALPDRVRADDLERVAIVESLELATLRREAEASAGRLAEARVRAFLPELGVGVAANFRLEDDAWEVGPSLRIGVPLFDQQQGPRARANAELRRVRNQLAATAVDLRAEARAARLRLLAAHAEAGRLRDVVLPLRQRIVDETLRQYNAMNATAFELLVARRDLVDAGRDYLDALRRYWTTAAEVDALRRGVVVDRRDR
ncbi:MAG TPA: TolC family protein [Kofleriaceae bacterium]|nr:TolC family protein [Kofleriaceae bacterium]